jgi:hypothetical protein
MKTKIRLGPELEGGRRLAFRRTDDGVSVGTLGPTKDGQPLPTGAELVQITNEHDPEGWHDMKVLYKHEADAETYVPGVPQKEPHSGPPQVATPAYRAGYDRIFGKQKVGLA